MELQKASQNGVGKHLTFIEELDKLDQQEPINDIRFIESNTKAISLYELKHEHIIPVFVKDNQPTISQGDFIQSAIEVVEEVSKKNTANLAVRVSHPIKGRTFGARHKKANDLLDHEKTIYYERMAFSFDLPSIVEEVNGQELTLSVVGVKAHNHDNLYSYGGSLQKFKIGMGFRVKVCTNMCLWTDGTNLEVKARSIKDLETAVYELVSKADVPKQLQQLQKFNDYELTEQQFATLLGRIRMYNHIPPAKKKKIPPLLISDTQISTLTKEYYKNEPFGKNPDGSISLWNLYNLFTDAVKSSYIDTFLDRNVNAHTFTQGIADALDGEDRYSWFLS